MAEEAAISSTDVVGIAFDDYCFGYAEDVYAQLLAFRV